MNALTKTAIVLITALVAIGSASFIQDYLDSMREKKLDEELLYLPNEKLLNHFTGGMSSVVADLLWLRTIQYTVMEFHNVDRKFTWLEQMCTTVTKLDPNFEGAYVHGGMLLAAIGADDKAMTLLKTGMANNPDSWEIPFEIAKIYLLNRRENPESPAMLAHYLSIVAQRSEDGSFYYDWIENLQDLHDLDEHAMVIWRDVRDRAKDDLTREIAETNILDLSLRMNVRTLQEMVDAYREQTGKPPEKLDDAVDPGLLATLHVNVKAGRFFLDAEGKAQNTVVLDNQTEKLRTGLNYAVRSFQKLNERYPGSLDELGTWANSILPRHPYLDREWEYDPETGELR